MLKPQREGGGKHSFTKNWNIHIKTLMKSLNFCSYKTLSKSLRFSFHIFGAVWMGEVYKCTRVTVGLI